MKSILKIFVIFYLGLLIGLTLNATNYLHNLESHQSSTSIQDVKYESFHTQIVSSDIKKSYPFGKFFFDLEEQEEQLEEELDNDYHAPLPYSKGNKSFLASNVNLYHSTFLTFCQPKKYLLFHRLKLDC